MTDLGASRLKFKLPRKMSRASHKVALNCRVHLIQLRAALRATSGDALAKDSEYQNIGKSNLTIELRARQITARIICARLIHLRVTASRNKSSCARHLLRQNALNPKPNHSL